MRLNVSAHAKHGSTCEWSTKSAKTAAAKPAEFAIVAGYVATITATKWRTAATSQLGFNVFIELNQLGVLDCGQEEKERMGK